MLNDPRNIIFEENQIIKKERSFDFKEPKIFYGSRYYN